MERVWRGRAACLAMASATLPVAKRRLRCCRRRGAVCADAFATRFSAQMFHVKHLFLYRTTLRQCVSRETCVGKAVRQGFVDRSGGCSAAARPRFDCRGRRRSFRLLFPWRAVRSCAARGTSGYSARECTISPSGCTRRRGGASRCAAGSARPRRRAVRSARERAVACAQVLHVGGSRACSAQVRRQSLPTRAFMMPDTMLMTMDATNALPNVAMSMPTWKIPLASHAATYSMSAFTTR